MKCGSLTRVLALDLHPRHFGYVVVESPARLLDWGVCSRRKGNSVDVLVRKRLVPLLELWRPSLLLIDCPRQVQPRKHILREGLLKEVAAAAKRYGLCIRMQKKRPAEKAESLTKFEHAQIAAKRFPVLGRSLPTKRKPWESEDYRMSMFAAAALAATFTPQIPQTK